ncbi:MAG: ABC transporter permease [Alphaproteobacteria bacterium]|nr:ABC transporter permease [Alphaproteobacteria bacterium]
MGEPSPPARGGREAVAAPGRSGPSTSALLLLLSLPILGFLLLPSLIIVPMSLTKGNVIRFPPIWISTHAFWDFLGDDRWIASTLTSLKVGAFSVVLASVAGATAAVGLHRAGFAGKSVVLALIMMPLATPVIVLALADYIFFLRVGLVGTWVGIGLAHSVIVTPYVFVATQVSLATLNPAQVRSARSLGATNVALLRFVYWPTLRPGILAGIIFAFAISLDEVVIALFLQGPNATTLPVQMFTSLEYDPTPKVAAVACLLLAVALLASLAQLGLSARAGSR